MFTEGLQGFAALFDSWNLVGYTLNMLNYERSSIPRFILIGLILAIPLVVFVFFYLNELQFPADAQDELTQYLDYPSAHPSQPMVEAVFRAKTLQNFTRGSSVLSFGDSAYFRTSDAYGVDNTNLKPLQYPPLDIWCIKIAYADAPYQIVLLALHEDLYNADWIVHDIRTSTEILNLIGCTQLLGE